MILKLLFIVVTVKSSKQQPSSKAGRLLLPGERERKEREERKREREKREGREGDSHMKTGMGHAQMGQVFLCNTAIHFPKGTSFFVSHVSILRRFHDFVIQ